MSGDGASDRQLRCQREALNVGEALNVERDTHKTFHIRDPANRLRVHSSAQRSFVRSLPFRVMFQPVLPSGVRLRVITIMMFPTDCLSESHSHS
jgi:hypothetical protein